MNNDLISREALKNAIENQDKFACLPDTTLVPFRMLNEPEKNYEPYVHLRDIRNAIDNAPTVEPERQVEKINKIPKDFVYDTETPEFYCYRNKYTGKEIHILKEPKTYTLERPTGDCISREDLKKYARTRISEEIVTNQVILKLFDELIDDAPAVEPICPYLSDNEIKQPCLNSLCERPQGECRTCIHRDPEDKKCDCGALERAGCPFPVSDDYFCKFYEKGGAE